MHHVTQKFHSYVYIQWDENTYSLKYMNTHVHSSSLHNCQKVKTAQMSISRLMDKKIVIQTYSELLCIHKRHEVLILLCERSQTQSHILYYSIYIKYPKWICHKHRMQIDGCQSLKGVETGESVLNRYAVLLWSDRNALELDKRWSLHNIVNVLSATELFTLS